MSLAGKKVLAIVQARMGSSRLPGKMMLEIAGKPAIHYVLERMKRSHLVDRIVLATTTEAADDALARAGRELGFPVFRGSETDVVERFASCMGAEDAGYSYLVRVCGDNFMICPELVDACLAELERSGIDIVNPFLENTYPFGTGAEVSTVAAFYRVVDGTTLVGNGSRSYREHVFFYAYDNPSSFRFRTLKAPERHARPEINLSVDTREDFDRVRSLIESLDPESRITAGLDEIIAYFEGQKGTT